MRRSRALAAALALALAVPASASAAPGDWDVAGTYDVVVEYLGVEYSETLVLTQSGGGTITGVSLGAPCSPGCANFTIASGSVVGDVITFDALLGSLRTQLTGTIAPTGSMSGTWMDVAGGSRTGTWWTTSGFATQETYDFTGFFAPVDNEPTLNGAKAGSAIPVKFSLNGDQGLNIFEAGYPVSRMMPCDAGAPVDPLEVTVTAGGSSLSYDSLTDTYNYVWKTSKAWAGTCRQLEVKLADGTSHFANFTFR